MTTKIRSKQDVLEKSPKDKKTKILLNELIDKRKKFLKRLRKWDYKKFEWILERLDLTYKPGPSVDGKADYHLIARKDSMRKLTDTYCENIRQKKLDEYRKALEAKQLEFLENKVKNLEFIRKEQEECKVPITIEKREIDAVKREFAELKQRREEEEELTKKQAIFDDYELKL